MWVDETLSWRWKGGGKPNPPLPPSEKQVFYAVILNKQSRIKSMFPCLVIDRTMTEAPKKERLFVKKTLLNKPEVEFYRHKQSEFTICLPEEYYYPDQSPTISEEINMFWDLERIVDDPMGRNEVAFRVGDEFEGVLKTCHKQDLQDALLRINKIPDIEVKSLDGSFISLRNLLKTEQVIT
jgi:hypothetical protein